MRDHLALIPTELIAECIVPHLKKEDTLKLAQTAKYLNTLVKKDERFKKKLFQIRLSTLYAALSAKFPEPNCEKLSPEGTVALKKSILFWKDSFFQEQKSALGKHLTALLAQLEAHKEILNNQDPQDPINQLYNIKFETTLAQVYSAVFGDQIMTQELIGVITALKFQIADCDNLGALLQILNEAVIAERPLSKLISTINSADRLYSKTGLIEAASYGRIDIVIALIEAGAELNHADIWGRTALILAAKLDYTEIVKILLEAGAKADCKDIDSCTALILAAKRGYTDTVKVLLVAGAEANCAGNDGCTALMVAAADGHTETVKTLLVAGCEVNFVNQYGGSNALIDAARHGHTEIVITLIKAGAELNHADTGGRTALILAATYGHTDTVKVLLEAGAEVDCVNTDGCSPLMLAVTRGHVDTAQVLLEASADTALKDKCNISVFEYAKKKGDITLKNMLAKYTSASSATTAMATPHFQAKNQSPATFAQSSSITPAPPTFTPRTTRMNF